MPMLASTSTASPSSTTGWMSSARIFSASRVELAASATPRADHRKFVSAQACDSVALTERAGSRRATSSSSRSPECVAQRVVDLLEAVQVDEHHGERRSVTVCFP